MDKKKLENINDIYTICLQIIAVIVVAFLFAVIYLPIIGYFELKEKLTK